MTAPRRTISDLLAEAQARLDRLQPAEAAAAMERGALLLDLRSEEERRRHGTIPGALHVPRTVLEWRVDPASGYQEPAISGHEHELILLCNEGYSSSLAAVMLHDLGLTETTDVAGGFAAWAEAGLPVVQPRA